MPEIQSPCVCRFGKHVPEAFMQCNPAGHQGEASQQDEKCALSISVKETDSGQQWVQIGLHSSSIYAQTQASEAAYHNSVEQLGNQVHCMQVHSE